MPIETILFNIITQSFLFVGAFILVSYIFDKLTDCFIQGMPEWVQDLIEDFQKVLKPISSVFRWLACTLTLNRVSLKVNDEGILLAGFEDREDLPEWYQLYRQIGVYLFWLIPFVIAALASGTFLYFVFPQTFSNVSEGIGIILNISYDSDFLTNISKGLYDLVWNRFVLTAFGENLPVFVAYLCLLILAFSQLMGRLHNAYLRLIPAMIIWVIVFNAGFALINIDIYIKLSFMINNLGILVVIAYIFMNLCCFLAIFFEKIIKAAFNLRR